MFFIAPTGHTPSTMRGNDFVCQHYRRSSFKFAVKNKCRHVFVSSSCLNLLCHMLFFAVVFHLWCKKKQQKKTWFQQLHTAAVLSPPSVVLVGGCEGPKKDRGREERP